MNAVAPEPAAAPAAPAPAPADVPAAAPKAPAAAPALPLPPGGLNDAFVLIYRIFAILIIIALVLFFALASYDMIYYYLREIRQQFKLLIDKNIYNKDTNDATALEYLKNNREDEPYNIFLQQNIVSGLFTLSGLGLITLGVQIGTFFALKLWAVIKRAEFTDRVDLPMRYLVILVFGYGAATILNFSYKRRFLKTTQPNLSKLRGQMSLLNKLVYNNLTDDPRKEFLDALKNDDMDTCIAKITAAVSAGSPEDTVLTPEDRLAVRMIFTLNLYGFFRYMIPDSDPVFDDIRGLFTARGIKTRAVEPAMYLYYKQPVYVPNLYPNMRGRLKAKLGRRENAFVRETMRLMRELNRSMANMQNISSGKKQVLGYLYTTWVFAFFFMCVLAGIFREEIAPYIGTAKETLGNFFRHTISIAGF